ncbi:MAG: hypothetical protein WD295_05165 [Bacteroidota bacterium]
MTKERVADKRYERTISREEALEGYILVLKDRLSWFPAEGRSFELVAGSTIRKTAVRTYDCRCRGLEEPHRHFVIPWKGSAPGDTVVISRDPAKPNRFAIRIRSRESRPGLCG